MRSYASIYVGLIVLVTGAFTPATAQRTIPGLCAPLTTAQPAAESEPLPDRSLWTELKEERTLYSRTWHAPGGYVMMQRSKRPINYYNDAGELVPIDAAMKPSANGWCAAAQPFPVYLDTDGSTALTIGKNTKMEFNKSFTVNGKAAKGHPSVSGNTFIYEDAVPGIDKEYAFFENAVKYNYVIKNDSAAGNGEMVISEELVLPRGYLLWPDLDHGNSGVKGYKGDMKLVNEQGEAVAHFNAPLCYDANNAYTIGEYKINFENGKYLLEIHVPASWLHDPSRSFPVTIDPLVTGPTSTWASGTMPSCIIPSYNKDSIAVTIPAGISITGLYVTSSFYADPFTTAVMSQGAMYFSTTCGQTTSFTVANPTGNTPGTAYLDSFNVFNPLMCCFQSSCNTRTFYLRMHLGRTGPSAGCNTTYIRYDPFSTLWPFSALVVGRTVETYGGQWSVPNVPICSNRCVITGTVSVRYGVPPYTVTHPWSSTPVTIGTLNGCNTGASQHTFTLTIPNCPSYCDTTSQLIVPPPIVTDACGNVVAGIPSRTVPLIEAPGVTATPPSLVTCSGDPVSIALSSCVNNSSISWYGNNIAGTGSIPDTLINGSTSPAPVTYYAYASANGCYSDTVAIPVTVDPLPVAGFNYSPSTAITNEPVYFTDNSIVYGGIESGWSWNFADNTTSALQNPSHVYAEPGTYLVCFAVTTSDGCIDTLCREVTVIVPDIIAPNVITPNNDGVNDLLSFMYLEFYHDNNLVVYNRWGKPVYERSGYANDWNAGKLSDGTYYYVLDVRGLNKTYRGFFEVLH